MPVDRIKLVCELVDFESVVRRYVGEIKNGFVYCPAHADKRPSAKVYKNGLHCFSCGFDATATQLVAKVLKISALEAAKVLNVEFGLGVSFEETDNKQVRKMLQKKKLLEEQRKKAVAEIDRQINDICSKMRECMKDNKDVWDNVAAHADITFYEYQLEELERKREDVLNGNR